jgi:calcium binding protein 39
MNSGAMLRECIRHESLARVVLQSEDFYKFFQFVETSNFDVAADAFSTFRVTTYCRH